MCYCSYKRTPPVGFEPTTPRLEVLCAIHCATRAIRIQNVLHPVRFRWSNSNKEMVPIGKLRPNLLIFTLAVEITDSGSCETLLP